MEMTRFEKFFVNRETKGRRNVSRVRRAVDSIDASGIRDVLEIGCGIGTASALLSEEFGWNVCGTDYDARQIEAAKSRYPESGGLNYQREDATQLSFPNDSFDFAFAQNVFHHIPEWRAAVRELARVLRPRGTLLWCDFVVPRRAGIVLKPFVALTGVCIREEVRDAFDTEGFELRSERRASPTGVTFDELVYRMKEGLCR